MNRLFTEGGSAWNLMLLVFSLMGCTKVSEPSSSASRVVVLGASVAEVVCDLGAGARVVGLDQSAEYLKSECPEAATLNYYRQLSSEGVLSLRPDLVLTTDQAGPQAALEQIRGSGVKLAVFPERHSWDGAVEKIQAVAGALGTVEKAAPLLENMKARKEAVGKRIRTAQTAGKPVPKVLFVMSQIPGSNALMVAGSATGAQAMIEMAGGINAAYGFERYKQMGNEALAEADPDLVLFALSPHHGFRDAEALRRHPALRDGTAVREGRIHGVDLGNSLNFGSRLGEAVEVWSALLHPPEDVKAAALAP